MKLAIMQPYFFPYLGYFQLIHAADKFVFYDDVNFIKKGWINRNRLLLNGKAHYFTVPLAGASQFRKIREIRVDANDKRWQRKQIGTFRQAYMGAPFLQEGMQLIESVLGADAKSIADLARESIISVMQYLGLGCELVGTSHIYANEHLKGKDRILDICRQERADTYINASGGQHLYAAKDFADVGVELRFLQSRDVIYPQGGGPFVPDLSVIDIIMRCAPAQIRDTLQRYELATPSGLVLASPDGPNGRYENAG